jgi:hypothetical protein
MGDKNKLEDQVVLFFIKELNDKKINKETILNNYWFFIEDSIFNLDDFFYHFNVNCTTFNIEKYFHPFPDLNWKYFLDRIRLKKMHYPEKPKITIGHMIEVAKRKEWFDPV